MERQRLYVPDLQNEQERQGEQGSMATRSPMETRVTEEPVEWTVPEASWPITMPVVGLIGLPMPPWCQKWTWMQGLVWRVGDLVGWMWV